jgi:signal transduction histidine kinase/PAS domain-containing protein
MTTAELEMTIDFAAILKASQSLSRTIQLDELLQQLTQMVLHNSGGDRCVLMLPDCQGQWQVRAIATSDQTQLCHVLLNDAADLPHKLIQYVKQTQAVVIIDDLQTDLPVIDDNLKQQRPQSLLCLPILNQGNLFGILYLHNRLVRGIFTSDRVFILNFLCTQAAIAIENAQLFETVKQAEINLQQSNAFLEAQRESSLDGILVVDCHRVISSYNQRFLDVWQVPSELRTTRDDHQMLAYVVAQVTDSKAFLDQVLYLYDHVNESSHCELLLKDGRTIERTSIPVNAADGDNWGRIWYFRDISDRKHSEAALQEKLRLFALRSAIDSTLTQSETLAEVLKNCTQEIVNHLEVSFARIWTVDATEQILELQASAGLYTHIDGAHAQVPVGKFKIGLIAQERRPYLTNDVPNDPRVGDQEWARREGMVAFAGYPLMVKGKLLGVLAMFAQQQLPESVLDTLSFVANEIGLGIERHQTAKSLQASEAELKRKAETLEQLLQDLKQTQLQMVQNEKMASLGNLVAGVAHEINNPIGFLNGSINNAKDYVKDLFAHLELYQQHYPSPVATVQEHAEEIDLEFLCEDLPKLLGSMKGATDRIKGISTSLRTFSRADTEYKVRANLEEGLDSTILILKYRLKANEFRPAIEVVQNYGQIPEIECFPGQLNQVFMNILANAIDMFDEAASVLALEALKANPQQITIDTVCLEGQVQIRINDNGKGMSEEVRSRIFDHLFTTKDVGKGTGLGLAIAHQIIVEKHGGTIEVQSEVGTGTTFLIQFPSHSF